MKLLSSSSIIASTALAITTSEDCKYPRQFHPSWGHFMRLSRLYSSAPEGNLKLYSFYFINLINMLLEGSRWGYKKITAAFTSSRTGLSDVVIRTTKCTKAIASISVLSRQSSCNATLLSLFCRHLEKRDCCPFFRNDVRVVKSLQNRAPLRFPSITNLGWYVHHFFRKPNFSFSCFEHYKVFHLLSQVLSMKFCAVNVWVCLSSLHTLKKRAFTQWPSSKVPEEVGIT